MDGYFIGYEGGAEVKRYCDSYYTVQFKTIHQGESGWWWILTTPQWGEVKITITSHQYWGEYLL